MRSNWSSSRTARLRAVGCRAATSALDGPSLSSRVALSRRLACLGASAVLFSTVAGVAGPGPAEAATPGQGANVPAGCLWAKAPDHSVPLLTATQASADLGQTVTFGGGSGPVTNYSCSWDGKRLPKVTNPEALRFSIELGLDLYYSANAAAASKLYHQMLSSWGSSTPAPGVGAQAAYLPGRTP